MPASGPIGKKELAARRRRAHRPARARKLARRTAAPRERELKFLVPAEAVEALRAELSADDCRSVRMQAVYFDTDNHALRDASIGLRLRREGDRWVQTLKAPGRSPWDRLEDSVDVGVAIRGRMPPLDPQRHRHPEVRELLHAALGEGQASLHARFEVDVQRRIRRVAEGRSVVEVAFDEGELKAAGRTAPVREIEFELVEGDEGDLVALARRWCERWKLAWHTASKAERGDLLADGELYGPAAGAAAIQLQRKPAVGEFAAAVLESCLHQVAANAGWVVSGSLSDDHIHQLRVGIRRLRTALRELPALQAERQRVEPVLADVFRALGERRDRTHVLRKIAPVIEAAGGSPLRVPPGFHDSGDPIRLVQQPAYQDALLALLERAQHLRREPGRGVRRALRPHLARLHKALVRDGKRFTRLAPEQQHRARKRLKRLRYLSEFVAPLYARDAVQAYLAELKPAQDALGEYNDDIMAGALYEELVGSDPGAAFGVEWLGARRTVQAKAARDALRKLETAAPFWRKD